MTLKPFAPLPLLIPLLLFQTILACPTTLYLAIGALTLFPTNPGRGITILSLRNNTLSKLVILPRPISGSNPTYLASSPPHFYATNGDSEIGFARQISFSDIPPYFTTQLSPPIPGGRIAHISVLNRNATQLVMTADFGAGTVSSFRVTPQGFRRADVYRVPPGLAAQRRDALLSARQAEVRPHMVFPYRRGVLVPDLGASVLFYLGVSTTGRIWEIGRTFLRSGDGSRHVAVHVSSGAVYVVNELGNSMVVMREVEGGRFEEESRWDLGVDGDDVTAAAIRVTADGRFVYVSVRVKERRGWIVGFEADATGGEVRRKVGCWGSGGEHPRDFYVVERVRDGGRCRSFLAVANRDSGNVVLIERNFSTGRLGRVRHRVAIAAPVSVLQYL